MFPESSFASAIEDVGCLIELTGIGEPNKTGGPEMLGRGLAPPCPPA